jgi:tail protein
MLTQVSAQNNRNGLLLLPLFDSSAGYSVQNIDGLGPVKATYVASTLAQQDGGTVQNRRRDARNIVLTLGLESDWVTNTPSQLRRVLYNFFMPKLEVTFGLYEDDIFWGSTVAEVESCEPVMFSADTQVAISLLCYDPDFYAPAVTDVPSLTVNNTTTQTITYEGTSESGIEFTLTFMESATSITLINTGPDGVQQTFELDGAFSNGDVLYVNSNNGHKAATLSSGGLPKSILSYLGRDDWITLQPGDNQFRAFYGGTATPYDLQYTAKYGGF